MKTFGLIGYPLLSSFSEKYFTEKFAKEGIDDCQYKTFPLEDIDQLPQFIESTVNLRGFNVTIPYKEAILAYLDHIEIEALAVGAVNTVKIIDDGILEGYNTDIIGFEKSFKPLLLPHHEQALILGTGGAAKAAAYVLRKLNIKPIFATRNKQYDDQKTYEEIAKLGLSYYNIIINTTPLGAIPYEKNFPNIDYKSIVKDTLCYDLNYNPEETGFLQQCAPYSSLLKNGWEMLILQAEAAWKIWQSTIS